MSRRAITTRPGRAARSRFLDAIRAGVPVTPAAQAAGVARSAVMAEIAHGRELATRLEQQELTAGDLTAAQRAMLDLANQYEEARGQAVVTMIEHVNAAAATDWRAAAVRLSHLDRREFGRDDPTPAIDFERLVGLLESGLAALPSRLDLTAEQTERLPDALRHIVGALAQAFPDAA